MKKEYSIIIIAVSIIFSGLWIGKSIEGNRSNEALANEEEDTQEFGEVLSLSDAANYLGISNSSLERVIRLEEKYPHMISGKRFPYTTVEDEIIIKKSLLNDWLRDANNTGRQYIDGHIK
ncbi:hypothetical protein N780_01315 [Pontibacillus chungwhensis BH030062]|uniref:Helix-turn-helix domain-containing protein n=1 Tax=Pontibacillus chungwhensis BH030062 TaxID=1385513 RepID=A0A0A2V0S9_9BACI|nr:DNA-binding protein [Pontibacillus chungwhensis]KGP92376.1 hypothetical protein N780_01315 [Pontibacillus chungwhensis BH030062]